MQATTLRVISGALVVAVAGGGYVAFRTVRPATVATVAQTTIASAGQVTETVSASGSVEAQDSIRISAPSNSNAAFVELPVQVGDLVAKGQTIAKLDPTTARNQLENARAALLSAEAKLQQTLDGLTTQERSQLAISVEQASSQVKSANRSLNDTRNSAALTAKSYALSVDTARIALDAAVKTAALNAGNYQAAIDTAKTNLDNAKNTASINEKTYQTTLDSAQASLDNAKKTAEINAKAYQNAVDQAQAAVENAKTNAGFSSTASTNSVNQATATLSAEIATLQEYQLDLANKQNAIPPDPVAIANAQAKVSAQTKTVANAQNALLVQQNNAATAAAKDSQTVKSAEQSTLTNAQTSQTLGLARDQQTIAAAEISVKNALTSRESGLAKDGQSIVSADTSLRNAIASQTSGLLKDGQTVTQAEASVRNALATQTSGLLKDTQAAAAAQASLANAQLSLRSTSVANSVKLAPAKTAEITSQQSQVVAAKVAVTTAETALAALTVVAPASGAITTLDARVGDTPAQAAFTVITTIDQLQVKVGFSEANAAKIKGGQRTVVSFDALPSVAISSIVKSVDLTATSVQNVATYFVLLAIPGGASQGVKPGMTASVEIIVNEAKDAVIVPSTAITTIGGRKSVTLRVDGIDTRTVIETGITGSQGTQVKSGVAAGDVLVLPSAGATTARIASVISGGGAGAPPGVGGG